MAQRSRGSTGRHGGPADPQALFQRAVADYQAGRLRQARRTLEPLLALPDAEGYITLLAGLVDAGLGDWKSAETRLETAVERAPRRVEGWMGLGNARVTLGRPEPAAEAYRRALELAPADAGAWNGLGVAYADMRRDHDALACFDKALACDPGLDPALRGRAEALARTGELEAACAAYRDLIARHGDDAALVLDLAELLERANRHDEAAAALDAAPALRQPQLVARGEALRARLLARTGDLDEALRVVRSAQRRTREDWLGFVEGNLLDRRGEAEAALSAFRRANAARARLRRVARLREQDVPGYLRHKIEQGIEPCGATAPGDADWCPAFIVGLPRSGTTLLDRMLAAHPAIQVLEEPESLRMAEAVVAAGGSIDAARTRYREYLEHTVGLDPQRLVVDKNPMHLLHLDLLPALFPQATVIHSLRHPYDAALSCFMQDFALNPVTVHFLELESTAEVCAQLLHMMRLHEQACPERVRRVHYEELVTGDFRGPLEPLLAALGLSWHEDIEQFAAKAADAGLIRSASYEQVTRGLYTSAVERWRAYAQWLGPFRETLGPLLEYWGYAE